MSFPKDFDPKVRPSENLVLSPLEQAQRYAENHIRNEKQESNRFQAFADYTDYYIAKMGLHSGRDFDGEVRTERQRENSLANIEETIRKRTNKIPGYRKELSAAKSLVWELEDAHKQSPYNTTNIFGAVSDLMKIKGEALERYSQPSVSPADSHR
jgi:hypothetical protein